MSAETSMLSRTVLQEALAGASRDDLLAMEQRLRRSVAEMQSYHKELLAEQEDLRREGAELREAIDTKMKDISKLDIGALNLREPELEEGPLDFLGRFWEKVKPRDNTVVINEHIGELKHTPRAWEEPVNPLDELKEQFNIAADAFGKATERWRTQQGPLTASEDKDEIVPDGGGNENADPVLQTGDIIGKWREDAKELWPPTAARLSGAVAAVSSFAGSIREQAAEKWPGMVTASRYQNWGSGILGPIGPSNEEDDFMSSCPETVPFSFDRAALDAAIVVSRETTAKPESIYSVTLRHRDGQQLGCTFGDQNSDGSFTIKSVAHQSIASDWNMANPSQPIYSGCRILEVNGRDTRSLKVLDVKELIGDSAEVKLLIASGDISKVAPHPAVSSTSLPSKQGEAERPSNSGVEESAQPGTDTAAEQQSSRPAAEQQPETANLGGEVAAQKDEAPDDLMQVPTPGQEMAKAATEEQSLLIAASITLDDGSVEVLRLFSRERHVEAAARFVQEHSLKAMFEEPLRKYLKQVEDDAMKFPVEVEGDLQEIRRNFRK